MAKDDSLSENKINQWITTKGLNMFSTLQNKTVTRVYRNLTDFEKLSELNVREQINLSDVGIQRLINRLKNKSFQFGNNQQSKLCIAILKELCFQIYHDVEYVTRDLSFVLIRRNFKGVKWFVKRTLDDELISAKRFQDQAVIDLLRKLDKSGIDSEFCDWIRHVDWELSERDTYKHFNIGVERQRNHAYWTLSSKLKRTRDKYKKQKEPKQLKAIKQLESELQTMTSRDMMDHEFKRLRIIRYGKDVLYGIIGSKDDARTFGKPIHHGEFVDWCDTQCTTPSSEVTKQMADGRRGRYTHGSVRFYLTEHQLIRELKDMGYNGFVPDKLAGQSHMTPEALIYKANRQIQYLYSKYQRCTNVSLLQSAWYVIEYSLYMTLCLKYKTSIAKLKTKYKKNGNLKIGNAVLKKPPFKVKKAL